MLNPLDWYMVVYYPANGRLQAWKKHWIPMLNTKERILETALALFAESGYEAVSTGDIAGALGLTKGALYRHYRNKRAILDAIVARMAERDARQAVDNGLPTGTADEMPSAYENTTPRALVAFSKAMFRYWTQDSFASRFRRMLAIEQFRDPGMMRLYQQYLVDGPLGYVADLFAAMGLQNPREEAAKFYGPMFFLFGVHDGADDRAVVESLMDRLLDDAGKRLETISEKGQTMDKDNKLIIRRETERDWRTVETLVRESFWNVYRPGCQEHYVLHRFRSDPAFVRELDFVMEKDGRIVGQNVFVRAAIRADDGREVPILAMGPICIAPDLQRQGLGKRLLDCSLEKAAALGFGAVCFEGNIAFYGKSGFSPARRFGLRYHGLPEGADDSFFLCKELRPGYLAGIRGEYGPPEGYFAAEREPDAFEAFDARFPPKEKKHLPGQLF